jgi:hypothetical protein
VITSGKLGPAALLAWLFVLAVIYSLVRPGSKAGAAVVSITNAVAAVVGQTTGYAASKGRT